MADYGISPNSLRSRVAKGKFIQAPPTVTSINSKTVKTAVTVLPSRLVFWLCLML